MKNALVAFVLLVATLPLVAQDQVISKKSNVLKFQSGVTGKVVSEHSNVLKYGQPVGHLTALSNQLAFGSGRKASQDVVESKPQEVIVQSAPPVAAVEKPIEKPAPVETIAAPPASTPTVAVAVPLVAAATDRSVATPKVIGAELGPEFATALPRYHALIIGVSKYTYSGSGFESLENPARDAKELVRVLTEKYSFEKSDVTFLEDPTRHQIIDAMELLSTTVGPKDNLLIFYAGHGYYDKQRELGYWLPSDARLSSKSEWIANSTVKDYLSTIRSKHTLLVTDACFGGSIFKTRSIDAYSMMKVYDLYKDPSRKAITSGNLTEVPDKSLFLEQLLKKLNDNPDDFLPAQKLFTRIYEPVTNNSSAIPKFGVIQGAGDEGGDFVFIRRSN